MTNETNKETAQKTTTKLVVARPDAWGRYWTVSAFDGNGQNGRVAISMMGATRAAMEAQIAKTVAACGWNVSEIEWAETRDIG